MLEPLSIRESGPVDYLRGRDRSGRTASGGSAETTTASSASALARISSSSRSSSPTRADPLVDQYGGQGPGDGGVRLVPGRNAKH